MPAPRSWSCRTPTRSSSPGRPPAGSDAARRGDTERGAGGVACRGCRGQGLPGVRPRAGVRARVPRAVPGHPARPERRRDRRDRRRLHPGRRRRRGRRELADRRRCARGVTARARQVATRWRRASRQRSLTKPATDGGSAAVRARRRSPASHAASARAPSLRPTDGDRAANLVQAQQRGPGDRRRRRPNQPRAPRDRLDPGLDPGAERLVGRPEHAAAQHDLGIVPGRAAAGGSWRRPSRRPHRRGDRRSRARPRPRPSPPRTRPGTARRCAAAIRGRGTSPSSAPVACASPKCPGTVRSRTVRGPRPSRARTAAASPCQPTSSPRPSPPRYCPARPAGRFGHRAPPRPH